MTGLDLIDAVNDPGTPGKTGDDRYGFDEQAGIAWALDGATDVSPLRPFPNAESGAAWFAETLSDWLLENPPSEAALPVYWRAALDAMRAAAAKETTIPLDDLPLSASPIASGVWARAADGDATFCWLGDCVALVDRGGGDIERVGTAGLAVQETKEARRMLALSEADMMTELQKERASQNTGDYWVFGLDPTAADHVNTKTVSAPAGSEILLMSDGFYRLIVPYASHTPETLFALIRTEGLLGAIRALRRQEGADADNATMGRIKRSDDACAVWLKVGG